MTAQQHVTEQHRLVLADTREGWLQTTKPRAEAQGVVRDDWLPVERREWIVMKNDAHLGGIRMPPSTLMVSAFM